MKFHIGPHTYTLVISDRAIFDNEGNQLEGIAVEGRRLLILSRIVEPERREEVAMHELVHAWAFHTPQPSNEEERCQLTATIMQQFYIDLEAGGGREAMTQIPMRHVPHLGKPTPAPSAKALSQRETFGRGDRMPCGSCDADTMVGSIANGPAEFHDGASQFRMLRWFRCEPCWAVQVWHEVCTPDGVPLGEFCAVPAPRIIRGAEADAFVAEHSELTEA